MKKKLSLELRRELLTRTAEDYASARKGIKSQIVDQLVATTGYGRKHAITLLNNPPSRASSSRPRRARYDDRVKRADWRQLEFPGRQMEFPAFSGLILTMRAWLRISKCGG